MAIELGFPPQLVNMIQQNLLERSFNDALFPELMFRDMVTPEKWEAHAGDTLIVSRTGLLPINTKPRTPGVDPTPLNPAALEQWSVTAQVYNDTMDTHMPSSEVELASQFDLDTQKLGMQAGQTLNHIVRNKVYNAYLSGNTYVSQASGGSSTTLRVAYLNGFTQVLVNGRLTSASGTNPLPITIAGVANTVVGFTADDPTVPFGSGTLTLGTAVNANLGDAVVASTAAIVVRSGGGATSNSLTATALLTFTMIQQGVSRLRQMNVPTMSDGTYHMHLDPVSELQLFQDNQFQLLYRGLANDPVVKQGAFARVMGVTFFRNNECPTSLNTTTNTDQVAGDMVVPSGFANAGTFIHRPILMGKSTIVEKYIDESRYITSAGVTGKIGNFHVTNGGVAIVTKRIRYILRAPLNRTQDVVAHTWQFSGDWGIPTDYTTGDKAAYKRAVILEHGAST